MIIKKVFNNNVLLVEDGANHEKIASGKGIGFKKREGEPFYPNGQETFFTKVEKGEFQWINSLSGLIDSVPIEYLNVSKRIVDLAEQELNIRFNKFLVIFLADHIYFAVKRNRHNEKLNVLNDVKKFYPLEFDVARKAIEIINRKFCIVLPIEETNLIAIHFVENELSKPKKIEHIDRPKDEVVLDHLLKIVINEIGYPTHSIALDRMTIHLNFLISRCKDGKKEDINCKQEDIDLLNDMLLTYSKLQLPLNKICTVLKNEYNTELKADEKLYLLLHLKQVDNYVEDE